MKVRIQLKPLKDGAGWWAYFPLGTNLYYELKAPTKDKAVELAVAAMLKYWHEDKREYEDVEI